MNATGMTRKHFQVVADLLSETPLSRATADTPENILAQRAERENLAFAFAAAAERDCPNFNRQRFLAAARGDR